MEATKGKKAELAQVYDWLTVYVRNEIINNIFVLNSNNYSKDEIAWVPTGALRSHPTLYLSVGLESRRLKLGARGQERLNNTHDRRRPP